MLARAAGVRGGALKHGHGGLRRHLRDALVSCVLHERLRALVARGICVFEKACLFSNPSHFLFRAFMFPE